MSLALDPHTDTRSDPQPVWRRVCALHDLEPEWGEAALVDGHQVALFRLWDGSVRAVSHQDPATGSFVLARGIVGTRAGRPTVASPLHKQVYDLASGECLSHPGFSVRTFAVRVTDGEVEILL